MKIRKTFRILAALFRIRLSRQMSDPAGYLAAFFVDTSVFLIQAAAFGAIYLNVDEIRGWDAWRSLFFVGTFTLVDGLFMAGYFFGLLKLPTEIASGRLDLVLAKPADPLLLLSFDSVNPGSFLLMLPAFGMLAAAVSRSGYAVTPVGVLSYAAAVALSLVLVYDLMTLFRTSAFWLTRAGALQEGENLLMEFAFRVPGKVYSGVFRLIFRVLLPYGLIAAFPVEAFFGEASPLSALAVVATVAAFGLLRRLAWKRGLARYSGTGS